MPFPRLQWGQWYLFICAAVVLLIPAVLAAFAPALAPIPAAASIPKWEAPPLPDRETTLPGFQNLLDPLPLVVRDLPDDASRHVAVAYDTATLFDPQPSREMLAAAERAIPVPPNLEATWSAWFRAFTSDSSESAPIPDVILDALRDDPRNGDRLSNLAIALYFASLTEKLEQETFNYDLHFHHMRQANGALNLLSATLNVFPNNRATILNYVFLRPFIFISNEATDPTRILDPTNVLTSWAADHPEDTTALQLLVFRMLSSRETTLDDPAVVALLTRLAETPEDSHAALGYSLLGDLKLRLAYSQLKASPFMAQETARKALREYDKALELSDDPSIYAARAETLEVLGDTPAAIASQERAVHLQLDSAPLRLRLGDLNREKGGDEIQTQGAMYEAREQYRHALPYAGNQISTTLREVQLQLDSGPYHPMKTERGSAFTAFRPARMYLPINPTEGMAGGGYIVLYDLIPAYELVPGVTGGRLPFQRAIDGLAITSVVLGEPSELADDIARLEGLLSDGRWPGNRSGTGRLETLRVEVVLAAQLVADLSGPSDVFAYSDAEAVHGFATNALRYAGFPAQAAALCRTALDHPERANEQSNLLRCVGENAYLAGDYDVARQVFADLEDPLYEGFVAQVAGDQDGAIRLYEKSLSQPRSERGVYLDDVVTSWIGDAYLESGDTARAIEHYDEVIQELTQQQYLMDSDSMALQHAYNNRGIARLKLLSPSGSAPDCMGKAATACADTLTDFEEALRFDPHNPVYLLGKGWVERLLGDTGAAVQTLNQAVQIDPTLFPALNDLGVLAVQAGDLPRARQAFKDALAVNPTYDLALWNLGVLEMQRGVSGLPRGQAYLARAILQNPSFVSSGLSYRTDEEIYRVEFNEHLKPGAGWSFASATSVATTAFGFIAVLAMILRAVVYLSSDKVQTSASSGAAKAVAWLDARVEPRILLPSDDGLGRWLPLLITLPALAFATSWSAIRENPGTAAANVFLALFAALTAVIVHETGHALAARKLNAQLHPAQWGTGTLLALVLLPVNLNAGPFPGQRVVSDNEEAVWWVHLSGPLANLLIAVSVYTLFFFQPLPGLRLIALVQFAAMSYALLPFDPLDGAVLSRSRPIVASGLAFLGLTAGLLFWVGAL